MRSKLAEKNCSIAKTLDIIGERWTLMILRDAIAGTRRFSQFQKSLGVSKNILSARLNRLVDEEIMIRHTSVDGGHPEYLLSEKGWDLEPVLLSIMHWGDKHQPHPLGIRAVVIDRATGAPIRTMAATSQDGRPLSSHQLRIINGPGAEAGQEKEIQRR